MIKTSKIQADLEAYKEMRKEFLERYRNCNPNLEFTYHTLILQTENIIHALVMLKENCEYFNAKLSREM